MADVIGALGGYLDLDAQGPELPADVKKRERERLGLGGALQPALSSGGGAIDRLTEGVANIELDQRIRSGEIDLTNPEQRRLLTPEQQSYVAERIRATRDRRAAEQQGEPNDVIRRLSGYIGAGERGDSSPAASGRKGLLAGEDVVLLKPDAGRMGNVGVSVGGRGDAALVKPDMRTMAVEAEKRRADAAAAALKGGKKGRPSNEAIWEGAKKDKARREAAPARAEAAPSVQAPVAADPYSSARAGSIEDALAYARAADERFVARQRNPAYGMTARNIAETKAAQEQITQGLETEETAKLSAAADVAQYMAAEERRMNDAIIDQRAAEFERQELLDQGRQAVEGVHKQLADATAKFNETQGMDPGRWWSNKSAGQKFVAVLGAVLGRMAGINPLALMQSAIDADLASQKANMDLGAKKVDAFGNLQRDATSVYETLRTNVADERTADILYEEARLGQAEQQFKSMLAQHNVQTLTAEHERFLGEIAQRRADLRLQAEQRAMANPKMITRVVKSRGAAERKVLGTLATSAAKASTELQAAGLKQRGDVELAQIKGEMEIAKQAAKGGGKDWQQQKWLAEKTEPFRNELKAIQEFKAKYPDDIPGVFYGSSLSGGLLKGLTKEQRQARRDLMRIAMMKLRRESGAAISEEELRREAENLVDGWSEGDVRADLDAREAEAARRIDLFERAPELIEVEQYRGAQMEDLDPITGQAGIDDPVEVDE